MEYPNYARQQLEGCWRRGNAHTDRTGVGGKCMQRQGASPMRISSPSNLSCRTCCNPRLPNVTLASLAPQARITSRTCERAASCFAQPPLASPRRIFSTPVFFPCAWSRRHLGLRAARALRHRESQRVERADFGLRHGRLRAHHSAYTPLPKRAVESGELIPKTLPGLRL